MSAASQSSYVDQMYSQWRADPTSVDASWQKHFESVDGGAAATGGSASQAEVAAIIDALRAAGVGSGGMDSG